jgi:hypothetical protein
MKKGDCGLSLVCIYNQADGGMLPLVGIMEAEEFVSTVQDRMIMKMMNNNNSSGCCTDDNQNDIDKMV